LHLALLNFMRFTQAHLLPLASAPVPSAPALNKKDKQFHSSLPKPKPGFPWHPEQKKHRTNRETEDLTRNMLEISTGISERTGCLETASS